jgi:hypothetical protein
MNGKKQRETRLYKMGFRKAPKARDFELFFDSSWSDPGTFWWLGTLFDRRYRVSRGGAGSSDQSLPSEATCRPRYGYRVL